MNNPKLIMLIGIPGSGKTTYAKKYIENTPNTIHLSSDKIREELWGDESIQGDNNKVFNLMQRRATDALKQGMDVVYDATNITRRDRQQMIRLCPSFAKIEARVVWAPINMCIKRDSERKRTVGKDVIDKMLKRFQPPYFDEGFNEIMIIEPDDFDSKAYRVYISDKMNIPHDNPHHTLNVADHCREAFRLAQGTDAEFMTAALFHDVGKPYVKGFKDTKGNDSDIAHFYSHDNVGAWMVYGIEMCTPYVAWLVGNHMGPFSNSRYYTKLPPFLKDPIDRLHQCDLGAH